MSYWVHLVDGDGRDVAVEPHREGGTYAPGGIGEARLNVTYNYAECYRLFDFSLRDLQGKRAGDTIDTLAPIVDRLGTQQYQRDYWAPTPGNAGHALCVLLAWARQHPDAIWEVE